ncbi:MAG TPA: hypothetical protein VN887_03280, partial [Candidatus Angelobacter sp.]|nr:hypothetical protein [Candidatus Angelobacter sp.]
MTYAPTVQCPKTEIQSRKLLLLAMVVLPVRLLAVAGDENWDDRFGPLGVDGNVNAIAVNGTNVYVGGAFTQAGGSNILNLARWDGRSWSALGAGISNSPNPYVYALAASGTDLYAGGAFTVAGGVLVNHIGRWDGTDWRPLGTGVTGPGSMPLVHAIAVLGSDVYVAGNFTNAGGIMASNIARWNGSSWSALGAGLAGQAGSMAV